MNLFNDGTYLGLGVQLSACLTCVVIGSLPSTRESERNLIILNIKCKSTMEEEMMGKEEPSHKP
jgi:hypothetical protein